MDVKKLTLDELRSLRKRINAAIKKKRSVRKIPVKYKDPKTGALWAGRGLTPVWARSLSKRKLEECRA